MNDKLKYKIAWHTSTEGLESYVNFLIELGWKPLGNMTVLPKFKESDESVFLQTLIMDDK